MTSRAAGGVHIGGFWHRALARALACAALALALASASACAASGDAARFTGTWDLVSGQAQDGGKSLSEGNVASLRELGMEAYLNLDESGSLALVNFDGVKYGSWEVAGQDGAEATVEGQSASITIQGDTLTLEQPGTTLVFSKGDPKASSRAADKGERPQGSSSGASAGLSDLVVKGALLDEPAVIADDDTMRFVVDGVGIDRLGDPGYNVQITNVSPEPIDVWVLDPFTVNGSPVKTYLFESVDPGRSATSFLQFDAEQVQALGIGQLSEASGVILVDSGENETIGRYPFTMGPGSAADATNAAAEPSQGGLVARTAGKE